MKKTKALFLTLLMLFTFVQIASAQRYRTVTEVKTKNIALQQGVKGVESYSAPFDTLQTALFAGANFKLFGTTTLVSGTKTITTTNVRAGSRIIVWLITPGGTLGHNYAVGTITAGTSFVINSYQSNATVQTGDTSVVGYIVLN